MFTKHFFCFFCLLCIGFTKIHHNFCHFYQFLSLFVSIIIIYHFGIKYNCQNTQNLQIKIVQHYILTKHRAPGSSARGEKERARFLPPIYYHFDFFELDELDLKKPPTKDSKTHTPKACQNVSANATPNRPITQLKISIPIHASKHTSPKTKPITKIIANKVVIFIISFLFTFYNYYTIFLQNCQLLFFVFS